MYTISVVLPTYNRLDRLKKVLSGLEAQTFDKQHFEVVVVSDGCKDGTNEYLQNVTSPLNIRPILQENQGVAAARNNGFKHAVGEYILFIDDDVYPTPTLIEEHLGMHREHEGEDIVVVGPMLTPNPDDFDMAPWVQWEQAMLYKQYERLVSKEWEATARQFYTGNTSLKKKFLDESGGFDTAFRRAEDVELAYRLEDMGLDFVFHMDAVGYHYADRSFDSWLNIAYVYGRNDVIFTLEKDQDWLLPYIGREYWTRHKFIHILTNLGLDAPVISNISTTILKNLALLLNAIGLAKVRQASYSGIYNLRYYQGIADELGGREKFFNLVNQERSRLDEE